MAACSYLPLQWDLGEKEMTQPVVNLMPKQTVRPYMGRFDSLLIDYVYRGINDKCPKRMDKIGESLLFCACLHCLFLPFYVTRLNLSEENFLL